MFLSLVSTHCVEALIYPGLSGRASPLKLHPFHFSNVGGMLFSSFHHSGEEWGGCVRMQTLSYSPLYASFKCNVWHVVPANGINAFAHSGLT